MANSEHTNIYNFAAIDIGSNAARMLIKQVEKTPKGIHMKKLQFLRIPLRLGFDVFTIGKIGKERREMLIRTMKIFRQLMVLYDVKDCLVYATSAFRDAKNGESIIKDIRKKTKVEIRIIQERKRRESFMMTSTAQATCFTWMWVAVLRNCH